MPSIRSGLPPLHEVQSSCVPIHRSLVGGEGQDVDVPDFRALGTSTLRNRKETEYFDWVDHKVWMNLDYYISNIYNFTRLPIALRSFCILQVFKTTCVVSHVTI